MPWYVSKKGDTRGPVDDETVKRWIGDGMTDAQVCDASGRKWMRLDQSPFAPEVKAALGRARIKDRLLLLVTAIGIFVLLPVMFCGFSLLDKLRGADRPATPTKRIEATKAPAPKISVGTRCELFTPDDEDVYLYPDRDPDVGGLKRVSPGTLCTVITTGSSLTQIRIEGGTFRGKEFYVRSGQVKKTVRRPRAEPDSTLSAEDEKKLQQALKDREPSSAGTRCTIERIDKPGSSVTLYRTYDGEADWDIATAQGDNAKASVFGANSKGPVTIASGTGCEFVDSGSATSKVRITAGPHSGDVLWTLTDWTKVRP